MTTVALALAGLLDVLEVLIDGFEQGVPLGDTVPKQDEQREVGKIFHQFGLIQDPPSISNLRCVKVVNRY